MASTMEFGIGDRVRLAPGCPIDFEGVGPRPGERGEILARPEGHDARRHYRVAFASRQPWWIPGGYLEKG